jgi:hypothetical protein
MRPRASTDPTFVLYTTRKEPGIPALGIVRGDAVCIKGHGVIAARNSLELTCEWHAGSAWAQQLPWEMPSLGKQRQKHRLDLACKPGGLGVGRRGQSGRGWTL